MSSNVELETFIDELIDRAKKKGYTPKRFIDMRYRHGRRYKKIVYFQRNTRGT